MRRAVFQRQRIGVCNVVLRRGGRGNENKDAGISVYEHRGMGRGKRRSSVTLGKEHLFGRIRMRPGKFIPELC